MKFKSIKSNCLIYLILNYGSKSVDLKYILNKNKFQNDLNFQIIKKKVSVYNTFYAVINYFAS